MPIYLNEFDQEDLVERFDILDEEANEIRLALIAALQYPDNARNMIRTAIAKLNTVIAVVAANRAEYASH